jgi:hypothetical protein
LCRAALSAEDIPEQFIETTATSAELAEDVFAPTAPRGRCLALLTASAPQDLIKQISHINHNASSHIGFTLFVYRRRTHETAKLTPAQIDTLDHLSHPALS